jgi:hypothetical protein
MGTSAKVTTKMRMVPMKPQWNNIVVLLTPGVGRGARKTWLGYIESKGILIYLSDFIGLHQMLTNLFSTPQPKWLRVMCPFPEFRYISTFLLLESQLRIYILWSAPLDLEVYKPYTGGKSHGRLVFGMLEHASGNLFLQQ